MVKITKSELNTIILSSVNEILEDCCFIGPDSNIDSIDIVQIISSVEDKLDEIGFEGNDLFEKIFECDLLTFDQLSNLILIQLNV